MIEIINGDLLETDCQIIAHGVNCQGAMGSGVAKALYEKWPEVKEKYLEYCQDNEAIRFFTKDRLLGRINFVKVPGYIVANCFTQQNYGNDGQLYLNYRALQECFEYLSDWMKQCGYTSLAIPKIGCGLAGGNWNKVKELLEIFPDSFTIKVYVK